MGAGGVSWFSGCSSLFFYKDHSTFKNVLGKHGRYRRGAGIRPAPAIFLFRLPPHLLLGFTGQKGRTSCLNFKASVALILFLAQWRCIPSWRQTIVPCEPSSSVEKTPSAFLKTCLRENSQWWRGGRVKCILEGGTPIECNCLNKFTRVKNVRKGKQSRFQRE